MPTTSPDSDVACSARRIVILGVTGSGKTTLAHRLGELRGLPVHEIDTVAWQPGWTKTPDDELRAAVGRIADADSWVIDALWSVTRDVVGPRAQLYVGLDLPRRVSLSRLLRRTTGRLVRRTATHGGNTETLRSVLGDDSILRWHARSFDAKRAQIRSLEEDPHGAPVLRFTSARAVDAWLGDPAWHRHA